MTAPARERVVRLLFIVARDHPELWHHLRRDFGDDEEVQVILDRRRGERRCQIRAREPERRRADRRRPPAIEKDLRYHSFVIIDQQ